MVPLIESQETREFTFAAISHFEKQRLEIGYHSAALAAVIQLAPCSCWARQNALRNGGLPLEHGFLAVC